MLCGTLLCATLLGSSGRPLLLAARTEAPLHQLGDESIERVTDDGSKLSVGHGVAHEVTRQVELCLQVSVGRELDLVTRRRERLDRWGSSGVTSRLTQEQSVGVGLRLLELNREYCGRRVGSVCRITNGCGGRLHRFDF
jgi:hypothetical protein